MTDSGGFTIDMTVPGRRRKIALLVLKHKLGMALHFRQTDRYALHAARGWALKEEPKNRPPHFRTQKQALAWVEAELAKYPEGSDTPEETPSGEVHPE